MMSVKFEAAAETFRPGKPARWMEPRLQIRSLAYPYALHPDGRRLAGSIQSILDDRRVRSFVLVTNFFDQLSADTTSSR